MATTSPELDNDFRATLLNRMFEDLDAAFYSTSLESMNQSSSNAINTAIADWSDWYWGNYEEWGPVEPWEAVYERANALFQAEVAKGVEKEVFIPVVSEDPVRGGEEFHIYGQVDRLPPPPPEIYDPEALFLDYETPEYEYFSYTKPETPWGLIAGAALAGLLLYKVSK